MGQQWPPAGTGPLVTADLGGTDCGISPLGGGRHEPHHRAVKLMAHKLEKKIIAKKF